MPNNYQAEACVFKLLAAGRSLRSAITQSALLHDADPAALEAAFREGCEAMADALLEVEDPPAVRLVIDNT